MGELRSLNTAGGASVIVALVQWIISYSDLAAIWRVSAQLNVFPYLLQTCIVSHRRYGAGRATLCRDAPTISSPYSQALPHRVWSRPLFLQARFYKAWAKGRNPEARFYKAWATEGNPRGAPPPRVDQKRMDYGRVSIECGPGGTGDRIRGGRRRGAPTSSQQARGRTSALFRWERLR